MKLKLFVFSALSFLICLSCIGEDVVDDFVNPELRIRNPLPSIALDEDYQFEARYLNNIGLPEVIDLVWSSSDESILSIDANTGLVTGIKAGEVTVMATTATGETLIAETTLVVIGSNESEATDNPEETPENGESVEPEQSPENSGDGEGDEPEGEEANTPDTDEPMTPEAVSIARNGAIATTSSYRLTGDFELEAPSEGALVLSLSQNYEASTSLPGLYVYLTNNPNSINGALEVGKVTVFKGEHAYELPSDIALSDFRYVLYWCKPFSVKVGGGDIEE